MGAKRETKISDTPGPGNYNANVAITQSKEASVRISQAKREDIWKDSTSKADIPGPGALDPVDHGWEERGFHFSRDDRFPN